MLAKPKLKRKRLFMHAVKLRHYQIFLWEKIPPVLKIIPSQLAIIVFQMPVAHRSNSYQQMEWLLVPWSKFLHEKLTVAQLDRKFSAFYGTRWFIIVSRRDHNRWSKFRKIWLSVKTCISTSCLNWNPREFFWLVLSVLTLEKTAFFFFSLVELYFLRKQLLV